MLDRLITLTHRQPHIRGGDIILEVNKGFWSFAFRLAIRNFPCSHGAPVLRRCCHLGQRLFFGCKSSRPGSGVARLHPVGQHSTQTENPVTGTSIEAGFMYRFRFETQQVFIPGQLAARL